MRASLSLFASQLSEDEAVLLGAHLEDMPDISGVFLFREDDGWRYTVETTTEDGPESLGLHAPHFRLDEAMHLGQRLEALDYVDRVEMRREAEGWFLKVIARPTSIGPLFEWMAASGGPLPDAEPPAGGSAPVAMADGAASDHLVQGSAADVGSPLAVWSTPAVEWREAELDEPPAATVANALTLDVTRQRVFSKAHSRTVTMVAYPFLDMDLLDDFVDRIALHPAVRSVEVRGLLRGRLELSVRLSPDHSSMTLSEALADTPHTLGSLTDDLIEVQFV
ncbi:MAG: hypothetical protein GEU28_02175 [Dehalococcoidia bacterium]|nr:hypothetical protein [Dehalococcoidia bacterium]